MLMLWGVVYLLNSQIIKGSCLDWSLIQLRGSELLESWMKDPKAKDRPDPLEAVVDIFPKQYINCFEGGREHVRLEQTQKICYVFFMVQ